MLLLPSVTLATLLLLLAASTHAQHGNPPGVPPRQQQNQQNQQQFDQQQLNVQEGHGHGGNKLRFQSEIHNAEHIIEHLQNVIKTKPKEQMSEEELEFHYFKMHDYDNNNKLDGVEIGKALTHFHDDDHPSSGGDSAPTPTPPPASGPGSHSEGSSGHAQHNDPSKTTYPDETIASLIDDVMNAHDKNDDGYVEYSEYKMSKAEIRA